MSVDIIICGGGLVSSLLACYLQKFGYQCAIYEKRGDLRNANAEAGRSINLILTSRGINAIEGLGMPEVMRNVLNLTVPVEGRQIHHVDGTEAYQPYGISDKECNYSINRTHLNAYLINVAESLGAKFYFQHVLDKIQLDVRTCEFFDPRGGRVTVQCKDVIIGGDGVGSLTRSALIDQLVREGVTDAKYEMQRLGVSYKEVGFPCKEGTTDEYAIHGRRLHIWPRGSHFLMALADTKTGTFTGTLYLPDTPNAPLSFETVGASTASITDYFQTYYPDAVPNLLPNYLNDFYQNAHSFLATVRCSHWTYKDRCILVGDAAHGVVPFFGQGMNSGFEDAIILARLLVKHKSNTNSSDKWNKIFQEYTTFQQPSANAIADMAIENYKEMAEKVGDKAFLARKAIETIIEKHMPTRYRSRYYMVTHTLIPFNWVKQCGVIQNEILDTLMATGCNPDQQNVWLKTAEQLVETKLTPYIKQQGIVLTESRKQYYPGQDTKGIGKLSKL